MEIKECYLKKINENTQKLLNVTNDLIYLLDLDGFVISLNEVAAKKLNKNIDALIGRCIYDFMPHSDIEFFKAQINKIIRSREPLRAEKEIFERYFKFSVYPIFDIQEEVERIAIFFHEISDFKGKQEKIKQTYSELDQIFESALPMCVIDKEHNIIRVNPNFASFFRLNYNDIIGKKCYDVWQGHLCKTSECIMNRIVRNKGPVKYELNKEFSDGTMIHCIITAYPYKKLDGRVIGAIETITDITERKKKEEELEKTYSKLNQIFNITIPLCVIDKKFNIIRINNTFSSIFNVKKEEIIGRKCYDTIPGPLCNTPECTMRQILDGKDHWDYEKDLELVNGTRIICNMRAVPYRGPDGEIIGAIQNYTDITARKKIEDMLKLNKERYSLATNAAKVGVWDWNLENSEFYLDPNIKMILGYSDDEIPNDLDAWEKYVHPDDSKGVMEAIQAHLEGKTSEYIYERRMLHKDGSIRWIQVRGRAIRDTQGNAIRMVGTDIDITAQKEADVKLKISEKKLKILNNELEQKVELRTYELKNSEEKIQNLINNISDVLMEGDIEGIITFISPQIYDIIEHQPKELIGIEFLELIHSEEKLAYEKLINITPKAGSKFSVELRIMHKKGYYVPISIKGSIEEINDKLKIFVVLRDITEKRKIDEMMKSEIKKLKELDQIRSDLIRRISHELKTPLISIFNGSQYLLEHIDTNYSDQVQDIIKLIHMGGYRLRSLVNNLIIAYNIESDEIKLNLKRENLIPTIKNCVEDIVFQANKRKNFINLELLSKLYVEVDKSMIKRAISNILSNAVKNTPTNGNIFISTLDHPNYIDIIVKDDGVGLTKKEKLLLFKRFGKIERFGKGMDVDIEGAGLGLYIANEIVKLHNGEIIVKSKGRNKGSTFIIRLPIN